MTDRDADSQLPESGISCEQALRQIERLAEDADLKEAERALLCAHVVRCAGCKAALDRLRRLESGLKDAFEAVSPRADFTERVLAALPPQTGHDSQPVLRVHSDRSARGVYKLRVLFAVAASVLLLAGAALWRAGGRETPADAANAPPILMELQGAGVVTADQRQTELRAPHILMPAETLSARNGLLSCVLNCNSEPLAELTLAPGSRLIAVNRHSYRLLSGAAYFHVFPNRPKRSPQEFFEVDAGGLGTVRVTGTVFAIHLDAAGGANVVVAEGRVEVHARTGVRQVLAGKELALNGHAQAVESNLPVRLAWKTPAVAALKPPVVPEAVHQVPAQQTPVSAPHWTELPVRDLDVAGRTLPEAFDLLAAAAGRPSELLQAAELSRKLDTRTRIGFSLRGAMPAGSAAAWLARDAGLRLERSADGSARLRPALAGEPIGAPEDGSVPPEILALLHKPMERLGRRAPPAGIFDAASAMLGVTIVCDRAMLENQDALAQKLLSECKTLREALDALQAGVAWHDHALYVASPAVLEDLTRVARAAGPLPALLGAPVQPRWARELLAFLERQTYPAPGALPEVRTDRILAGRLAFRDVALQSGAEDGLQLRYNTGLAGQAVMLAVLGKLASPSPLVPGAAGLLTEPLTAGSVPDIETLARRVQDSLPVEIRGQTPPFSRQAFAGRGLPLGEALELAARLGGRGVRREHNLLIVDDLESCYGRPGLQVLSTEPLSEARPELAASLPEALAKLLPAVHPLLFEAAGIGCVKNAVFFTGDRRQLQAAQRLRKALEQALEAAPGQFDAAQWRPAWQREIERNLQAPFQAMGAESISGTFAGLLRQSALSSQLHCPVLVDIAAMKAHADDAVEIRVTAQTVGGVLQALVRSAGLRMQMDGRVIWIRP